MAVSRYTGIAAAATILCVLWTGYMKATDARSALTSVAQASLSTPNRVHVQVMREASDAYLEKQRPKEIRSSHHHLHASEAAGGTAGRSATNPHPQPPRQRHASSVPGIAPAPDYPTGNLSLTQ